MPSDLPQAHVVVVSRTAAKGGRRHDRPPFVLIAAVACAIPQGHYRRSCPLPKRGEGAHGVCRTFIRDNEPVGIEESPPMLRKLVMLVVVLALIGAAAFWYITAPQRVAASARAAYTPNLANGKAMFFVGGCASCHATPKQEDKTRLGGGLGLKSPFGTFFTPNISPDRKDGIGGWSEAD